MRGTKTAIAPRRRRSRCWLVVHPGRRRRASPTRRQLHPAVHLPHAADRRSRRELGAPPLASEPACPTAALLVRLLPRSPVVPLPQFLLRLRQLASHLLQSPASRRLPSARALLLSSVRTSPETRYALQG